MQSFCVHDLFSGNLPRLGKSIPRADLAANSRVGRNRTPRQKQYGARRFTRRLTHTGCFRVMRENSDGYAIAEMLASLLIMGMISVLMVSGVVTGQHVWERMDAVAELSESVGGAQMLLRQRIERAFPVTQYNENPPFIDFYGNGSTLVFLAPPRDAQSPQGLRRYRLWLNGQGNLVLSSASDLAIDPNKPDENLTLLKGVQSLDLAYFGATPKGDSIGWQLGWLNRLVFPRLIRIHVEFRPGDPRQWPDMLIKPLDTIDSGCVVNTATGGCRGRGGE
jgi:general secretion pathway protein J